jgi:hypothetical protein
MSAFLYVYVDDTDSTYKRALAADAISLEEPVDMPYGDRRPMVREIPLRNFTSPNEERRSGNACSENSDGTM